jgi:hypothetical protein
MSYRDYYLRFPDEAKMREVWPWMVQDFPCGPTDGAATFVGTVGNWYLVNLRMTGELPEALAPFLIEMPAFPKRVWA